MQEKISVIVPVYKAEKYLNRGSDLTIADFWGIKNVDGDMFNKNGVSLVLINSEKGKRVFDIISKETVFKEESLEEALKYNPSIISSSKPHEARNGFLRIKQNGYS